MTPYYSDDACTIYHGDCREVAPVLGESFTLVTDPPYGMGWNTDTSRFSGGTSASVALDADDRAEFLVALDDPAVPYTALETVLSGRGVPVSDSTLRTWRQKRASRG